MDQAFRKDKKGTSGEERVKVNCKNVSVGLQTPPAIRYLARNGNQRCPLSYQ
jgi:hypothetical protein